MNRNNFFVKFAHFYLANITGMKEQITEQAIKRRKAKIAEELKSEQGEKAVC